jgi:DNA-binding HxlR family transcriptional regulator
MFDNSYPTKTILKLLSLYENKGREFYYNGLFERDLKTITSKFLVDDLINIAYTFDIKITYNKLSNILKNDYVPKTKDEQLYLNLTKTLHVISEKIDFLSFNNFDVNRIISLVNDGLTTKVKSSSPDSLIDKSKTTILSDIIKHYASNKDNENDEYITLIGYTINQFYCEKFYKEYNYETSVFLMYLLALKRHKSLKFCSFFSSVLTKKEALKDAFNNSEYYYAKGIKTTNYISEVLIDILLDAYQKIASYANQYKMESSQTKSKNLIQIILRKNNYFNVKELKEEFPNASKATIDRTLNKLKEANLIEVQIRGRSSFWQVTNKGKEETNINTKLFED